MGATELKIGQRIDVFEIVNHNYPDKAEFINGRWYAQAISRVDNSNYGRDIISEKGWLLCLNIPDHMRKVGTLIIKSIK